MRNGYPKLRSNRWDHVMKENDACMNHLIIKKIVLYVK